MFRIRTGQKEKEPACAGQDGHDYLGGRSPYLRSAPPPVSNLTISLCPVKRDLGSDFNTWPTNSTVSFEYLSKYLPGSSYWSDLLTFPPPLCRFSPELNLTSTGFSAREICPLAFCFRLQKCPTQEQPTMRSMPINFKKNDPAIICLCSPQGHFIHLCSATDHI